MAVTLIGATDAYVGTSMISSDVEGDGSGPQMNWSWPSTTVGHLIVWTLAYSCISSSIPNNGLFHSTDGLAWDDDLGNLLMLNSGSRGFKHPFFYTSPSFGSQFMHGGMFIVEPGLDPDQYLGWSISPFTSDPDYRGAFSGQVCVAAYDITGSNIDPFFYEAYTAHPTTGDPIAPTYPLTIGDVIRWVAYLSDAGTSFGLDTGAVGNGSPVLTPQNALDPEGTWTVDEAEFTDTAVEGRDNNNDPVFAPTPAGAILRKDGVADNNETWNDNRSVLAMQVTFDSPVPPDPDPGLEAEPGIAFNPPSTTFTLDSATQPGPNRLGLETPLYPYGDGR